MVINKSKVAAAALVGSGLLSAALVTIVSLTVPPAPALGQKNEPPRPAARTGEDPAGPAATFLQQALEAAADVKDPGQKARLLILIAEAQASAGDRPAALQNLRRAFDLADSLPNNTAEDFNNRFVLSQLAQAQAGLGDVDGALKTLDAYRKPKVAENEKSPTVHRVWDYVIEGAQNEVARALVRAGRHKEAGEVASKISDKFFGDGGMLLETAVSHARAGDWKRAHESIEAIKDKKFQAIALCEVAKVQAKAGLGEEARAGIARALKIARDNSKEYWMPGYLRVIAQDQAEVEGVQAGLATAETIPILPKLGAAPPFPFKHTTVALLRARGGDFDGAKDAAREIDAEQWDFYRGYAFRVIAKAQAEAKDVNGALKTVGGIEHPFNKATAYTEIALAQARAGDRDGAAGTFEQALQVAQAVPDNSEFYPDEVRTIALRTLAAAQAEAGQANAAQAWIAKLSSPALRAFALVGLAEGIAQSRPSRWMKRARP